jgi:hypothetical protein
LPPERLSINIRQPFDRGPLSFSRAVGALIGYRSRIP